MKGLLCIGCFLAAAGLSAVASATPVIAIGNHPLLENTANQQITISVSGGDAVEGLNLYVATGDGGDLLGGVDGSAPAITGLDIIGVGTIFGGNNTGQGTPDQTIQFWGGSTTTTSGTVAASGVLATITIDTTGFFFDSVTPANNLYALVMDFEETSPSPDTDFAGIPASISNGTLEITQVPEPAAMALLLPLGALLLRRRQ
jgi:hypothetical protein